MPKNVYHVATASSGEWEVFKEGDKVQESRHKTREDALRRARELAGRDGGFVKVREEESVDPGDIDDRSFTAKITGEEDGLTKMNAGEGAARRREGRTLG
jgi:hypothetical protein